MQKRTKDCVPTRMVLATIETIAKKKANANCLGFMYEPKKPEKFVKEGI